MEGKRRECCWNGDKLSLENAAKLKLAHDHVKLELHFPQTGNVPILHLRPSQLLMEPDQNHKAHLSANSKDGLWR